MNRILQALSGVVLALAVCPAVAGSESGLNVFEPDPVAEQCVRRGGNETACACVSREVRTRFDSREQTVIIVTSDPDLSDRERTQILEATELSSSAISGLIQRMTRAEVVIRQSCGAGLLSGDQIN
jgi:hypothetical protein